MAWSLKENKMSLLPQKTSRRCFAPCSEEKIMNGICICTSQIEHLKFENFKQETLQDKLEHEYSIEKEIARDIDKIFSELDDQTREMIVDECLDNYLSGKIITEAKYKLILEEVEKERDNLRITLQTLIKEKNVLT